MYFLIMKRSNSNKAWGVSGGRKGGAVGARTEGARRACVCILCRHLYDLYYFVEGVVFFFKYVVGSSMIFIFLF